MKIQKISTFVSIIVCFFSVVVYLLIDYYLPTFRLSEIFIGIFSSGIVVVVLSVSNYFVEKKRLLENYYFAVQKVLKSVRDYPLEKGFKDKVIYLSKVSEVDLSEMQSIINQIRFFKKSKSKVIREVHLEIMGLFNPVTNNQSFLLRCIKEKKFNKPTLVNIVTSFETRIVNKHDDDSDASMEVREYVLSRIFQIYSDRLDVTNISELEKYLQQNNQEITLSIKYIEFNLRILQVLRTEYKEIHHVTI